MNVCIGAKIVLFKPQAAMTIPITKPLLLGNQVTGRTEMETFTKLNARPFRQPKVRVSSETPLKK